MKNLTPFERKSILIIVLGFLGLFIFLHFVKDKSVFFLLWISVSIGSIAMISSKAAKAILWIWFGIAKVLGWINSRIILTLVFYLFLTPISLLYRLFNGDQLKAKKGGAKTMYETRNHTFTAEDLDNMW